MKNGTRVLLAVAVIAALMVGLAAQVQAQVARVEIEAYEYTCSYEGSMENVWDEGGVLHIRNYTHVNLDESIYPELAGINTTIADGDINMKNGNTSIRGTMSFKPDTIDGTWEGHWTFIANNGVSRGYAVGHGTGELSGKTLFLELFDAPTRDDSVDKCASIGYEYQGDGNTIVKGYILDTN